MPVAIIIIILLITGCSGHKATGYNIKASVGQTQYDDGRNNLYTGSSIDIHFDIK